MKPWRIAYRGVAVGLVIVSAAAWVAVLRRTIEVPTSDGAFAARALRLRYAPAGSVPGDPFGVGDIGTSRVLVLLSDRCRSCWPLTTELASVAETAGSLLLVLTTDIDDPAARRARQSGLRALVAHDVDQLLYDKASADSVAVLVRADGRSVREWTRRSLTVESARAALAVGS